MQAQAGDFAAGGGPVAAARGALCERVYQSAGILREPMGDKGDGSFEALDAIATSGALTTIDPFEAWAEGRATAHLRRSEARKAAPRTRAVKVSVTRDDCLRELAVVSCLDRMHAHALALGGLGGNAPRAPVALPDALVASIHAMFNAAYVYPHLSCSHELLSVGAWLGNLVKGRPALMPVFVAAYLAEDLARVRTGDVSEGGRAQSVLRYFAEQAAGADRLRELAERVVARGRPVLVKPRAVPALGLAPYVWNAVMFRQIARRLEADRQLAS